MMTARKRRVTISAKPAIAGCVLAASLASGAPTLVQPLEGTPYVDWTIVNYVDHDTSSGIRDYRGGGFTYDGHDAIDFTLPSFVWMDCGVAVYAAAGGTVSQTHDGEFDRNTSAGGFPANYVIVNHGNGWDTRYWHLRKNSVGVTNGQTVLPGQKMAEVGSSRLPFGASRLSLVCHWFAIKGLLML